MAVKLATRMNSLRASDIREMLKITQREEIISFAGGLPAPEFFPVEELAVATMEVLQQEGRKALQYSTTEGYPPLRERIAERMQRTLGSSFAKDEILITCGSQQGLDLTGKLFLDERDAILCESPTYLGAISAFKVFAPRWVEVPTDDEGMDVGALERFLEVTDRVKLVYVVPNFQNPSGRTWSRERRERFMEVVSRFDVAVLEDNPYGELRYEGESLPSLSSLDRKGQVVCLGTFSKIFCPGLRIAWLAARSPLYEKYVILKQGTDLHTATLAQMQIAKYMERFDLDANITRIRKVYRRHRDAMVNALEKELPPGARFSRPAGGLFLWLELPAHLDARMLLRSCLEHNVAFVPGGAFFPNGNKENYLRLCFSNMPVDRITEGIRRLAAALKEMLTERDLPGRVPAQEEVLI
jgi:2-aminoadipate transaminase